MVSVQNNVDTLTEENGVVSPCLRISEFYNLEKRLSEWSREHAPPTLILQRIRIPCEEP